MCKKKKVFVFEQVFQLSFVGWEKKESRTFLLLSLHVEAVYTCSIHAFFSDRIAMKGTGLNVLQNPFKMDNNTIAQTTSG